MKESITIEIPIVKAREHLINLIVITFCTFIRPILELFHSNDIIITSIMKRYTEMINNIRFGKHDL